MSPVLLVREPVSNFTQEPPIFLKLTSISIFIFITVSQQNSCYRYSVRTDIPEEKIYIAVVSDV